MNRRGKFSFLLAVLLISVFSVSSAWGYQHWYTATGGGDLKEDPYKWQALPLDLMVSVNTDVSADKTAAFTELKNALEGAWNGIPGVPSLIGTITMASPDFTSADFGTRWGKWGDGQMEIILDYDFSCFEAVASAGGFVMDKARVNGYGPSRREVKDGKPSIVDAYTLVNRTRDNFDYLSTVVHELGHNLGLAHSSVGEFNSRNTNYMTVGYASPTAALDPITITDVPTMHPFSNGTGEGRRTPKTDDKAGLWDLYGVSADVYGGISGKVVRVSGDTDIPVPGANVRAVSVADNKVQATRYSAYNGNDEALYVIGGLPPGDYKVIVEPMGYNGFAPYSRMAMVSSTVQYDIPTEYFSNPETAYETLPDTAEPLTVAAGSTLIGKDIKLGTVVYAFVVDDTGSMSEEIAGTRDILKRTINTYKTEYEAKGRPFPFIAIYTFKDNVTLRKISNDPVELQATVDALTASGGGDCPESSNAALMAAGAVLSQNSQALLFTDADSRSNGPTTADVQTLYNAKKMTFSVLLSGTCTEETTGASTSRAGTVPCSLPSMNDDLEEPAMLGVESAVRTFSSLAGGTLGTFAYIPEVNTTAEGRELYTSVGTDVSVSVFTPKVTLLSPTDLYKGGTMDISIEGANTNFTNKSTVSFGDGITVNDVAFVDSRNLRASVTVGSSAPVSGDITVTTVLGEETEVATGGLFFVKEATAPTLLSASPSVLDQGKTVVVTFDALNTSFDSGTTLAITPSTSINIVSSDASSFTKFLATLEVSSDAAVRFYDVAITTGSSTVSKTDMLRVQAPVASVASIESIVPSSCEVGKTAAVTITGSNTHFESGKTSVTFSGSGITTSGIFKKGIGASAITVESPTVVKFTVSVSSDATVGYRTVTVTTEDENVSSINGFYVAATGEDPPTPTPTPVPTPTSSSGGGCNGIGWASISILVPLIGMVFLKSKK